MADESVVKLMSSEGDVLESEPKAVCMSTLIKDIIDDDNGIDEEIPLPNVRTDVLSKVIDYCNFHKHRAAEKFQTPLKSTDLTQCGISGWDCEYINVDDELVFELILAADYLGIESLKDLGCAKIASKVPSTLRSKAEVWAYLLGQNECDSPSMPEESKASCSSQAASASTSQQQPTTGTGSPLGSRATGNVGNTGKVMPAARPTLAKDSREDFLLADTTG